jgi:hypothetical protein
MQASALGPGVIPEDVQLLAVKRREGHVGPTYPRDARSATAQPHSPGSSVNLISL